MPSFHLDVTAGSVPRLEDGCHRALFRTETLEKRRQLLQGCVCVLLLERPPDLEEVHCKELFSRARDDLDALPDGTNVWRGKTANFARNTVSGQKLRRNRSRDGGCRSLALGPGSVNAV